jgi:NADH-quinone oxidoreductase subunit J
MQPLFYSAAAIAILSTILMLTRLNAVHALLYLIVSLLAVAVVFYTLGAPFIAALEVIIYAGAIMVLFIFVVMLLNLGERATELERTWVKPKVYIGPMILAAILIAEFVVMLSQTRIATHSAGAVGPKEVGAALYGPYLVGVELASLLLLGALVGAYHLGTRKREGV